METKTLPVQNEKIVNVSAYAERVAFNLDILQAEAARMVRFAGEMRAHGALA
jgi:hypothetical protein